MAFVNQQQQQQQRQGGFKRKRNNNAEVPESSSKIKKRIRDINRTLNKKNKDTLSAQAIIELKRKLRTLQYELGERVIDDKEQKMATKYHAVKHFERKKTERKINQIEKQLKEENDSEKKRELQVKLEEFKLNMLYIRNYPKTVPYVSLYPKDNENDEKSVARKQRILQEIKTALEKGDKSLREFTKSYRDKYREKLIKQGIIIIEPLAEDEEQQQQQEEGKEDEDDFFEK
ncbi:hypothetical protein G6F70_006050 [Rhizopus microsporus]|uniref:rRNA-processing protein EFG1 n=2 Tax=Rhizopus TaxID=4842 RepID=A0A367K8B6_RHIAZ|nr:hypothetical protein G6F71_005926 [Rhizopus microsporus]KAG1198155.1 hypothetical protein G6F70_006050 [Rhizopus microsporus]KAG1209906.1 hypothetical protein G6F69_005960 [Rhizopus microsporus]ORE13992.1 hypothetical protein BCV71DRAFT_58411 [Rhizopus microsporus]RCH98428.1 18S rRNA maturation protein [Rhizopus azygosporus]